MLTIFSNKPGLKLDNNSCKLAGAAGFEGTADLVPVGDDDDVTALGLAEDSICEGDRSIDGDLVTGSAGACAECIDEVELGFDDHPWDTKSVTVELPEARSI